MWLLRQRECESPVTELLASTHKCTAATELLASNMTEAAVHLGVRQL